MSRWHHMFYLLYLLPLRTRHNNIFWYDHMVLHQRGRMPTPTIFWNSIIWLAARSIWNWSICKKRKICIYELWISLPCGLAAGAQGDLLPATWYYLPLSSCVCVVIGTTCNIYVVVFLGWQAAYSRFFKARVVVRRMHQYGSGTS